MVQRYQRSRRARHPFVAARNLDFFELLQACGAQGVANLVWSCATLLYVNMPLIDAIAHECDSLCGLGFEHHMVCVFRLGL